MKKEEEEEKKNQTRQGTGGRYNICKCKNSFLVRVTSNGMIRVEVKLAGIPKKIV